jgi:hypothetical protein
MALVVGAAVLCVAPAGATSLAPLTIDQMTDGADLIVRGTITDVWTTEVDGVIYTRADLEVSSLYKGSHADTHLTLESLGGTFEGMTMDVDAAEEEESLRSLAAVVAVESRRSSFPR